MQERSPEHIPFRREIGHDSNAKLYGELIPHLGLFEPETWVWGVNYFFLGSAVINLDMEQIYIKGNPNAHHTYPTPEGYCFFQIDEMRAHELEMGRMQLPKNWDDFKGIADRRRHEVRQELLTHYELFEKLDHNTKEALRQTLQNRIRGKELKKMFSKLDPKSFESATTIYLREKQVKALDECMQTIELLRKRKMIRENIIDSPTAYMVGTYDFPNL